MFVSSRPRSRRFVPALDLLPSRLTPSNVAAVVSPMDPVMLGPDEPPPPPVVVSPMDPVMLGPDDPTANCSGGPSTPSIVINAPNAVVIDPTASTPDWGVSAASMGDMVCTTGGTDPNLTCW